MKDIQTERNEAVAAAETALDYLYQARDTLKSASNWGLFDLFAGGGIVSYIKRDKMANAEQLLNAARDALRTLAREVSDLDDADGIHIDTSSFLSFADIFFDNPFLDMYVQGQISEARQQVEMAIGQVEALYRTLTGTR